MQRSPPRPILKSQLASDSSLIALRQAPPVRTSFSYSTSCSRPSSSLAPPALPFATCSTADILPSPHVHFPPTPRLTETAHTHSSGAYDRAPIEICENTCALPERGGRTYSPSPMISRRSATPVNSYFHPRAREACTVSQPPPLVSDYGSSESEDSEDTLGRGMLTPPDPRQPLPISIHFSGSIPPVDDEEHPSPSRKDIDKALAFLPHPPSPRRSSNSPERMVKSPPSERARARKPSATRRSAAFSTPELDPCLGGF